MVARDWIAKQRAVKIELMAEDDIKSRMKSL